MIPSNNFIIENKIYPFTNENKIWAADSTRRDVRSKNFLQIDRKILQRFGALTAIILCNLIDKDDYHKHKHPKNNGWFFSIHQEQIRELGVTEGQFLRSKKELKTLGILQTQMKGIPPKEWYSLDYFEIGVNIGIIKTSEETSPVIKNLITNPPETEGIIHPETRVNNNKTIYNKNITSKEVINTSSNDLSDHSQSSFAFQRKTNPPVVSLIDSYSIPRGTAPYEIVKAWNNGPGQHTTHDLCKKTDVLDTIKKYYNELIKGTFLKRKKFSPEWLSKNPAITKQIDQWERTAYRFSHSDILKAVTSCCNYTVEGYWPKHKKGVPKSLSQMLFNPQTGVSWFLMAMVKPPSLLHDEVTTKERYPEITNRILSACGADRNNDNVRKIETGINKLIACWDRTTDVQTYCYRQFGRDYRSQDLFINEYIKWVSEQPWLSIGVDCFTSESGVMRKWFEHLKDYYDYGDEGFHIITS